MSSVHSPSTDNGGPGTYSQLLLMKEYMSRIAWDLKVKPDDVYPADHFHLIGGVGFGGYVSHTRGALCFHHLTGLPLLCWVISG